MKTTLLDIVQRILSSMDSDEVNSISDTVESMAVANVVREAWESIVVHNNLPEHYKLFHPDPSTDPTKPTMVTIPSGIDNILWIKYNKLEQDETDPNWYNVRYLDPVDFLDLTHKFLPSEDNVGTFEIDDILYHYQNDKHPEYYTTFNDRIILFDSYHLDVDDTIQSSKTLCYGLGLPQFRLEDDFYPDLDAQQFPLLINEAKALAHAELKQTTHAKAEKMARRGWVSLQHNKSDGKPKIPYRDTLANYGRR